MDKLIVGADDSSSLTQKLKLQGEETSITQQVNCEADLKPVTISKYFILLNAFHRIRSPLFTLLAY